MEGESRIDLSKSHMVVKLWLGCLISSYLKMSVLTHYNWIDVLGKASAQSNLFFWICWLVGCLQAAWSHTKHVSIISVGKILFHFISVFHELPCLKPVWTHWFYATTLIWISDDCSFVKVSSKLQKLVQKMAQNQRRNQVWGFVNSEKKTSGILCIRSWPLFTPQTFIRNWMYNCGCLIIPQKMLNRYYWLSSVRTLFIKSSKLDLAWNSHGHLFLHITVSCLWNKICCHSQCFKSSILPVCYRPW